MRIGILTFCYTVNYGAELQAYALEKVLNSFNDVNAELLDYKSTAIFNSNKPVSIKDGKSLKQKIKYFFAHKCAVERWNKFRKFDSEYISMSQNQYEREKGISTNDYDCFIIGSDQVWNMELTDGDTNFFLPDIAERKKICSYAASFGYDKVPDKYFEITQTGINSILQISVREKSGKKIIYDLCNKKAEVVLDPTLLLRPDEWKKIVVQNKTGYSTKRPYVLLYLVDSNNTKMWNYVNNFAKINKLDILWITPRRNIGLPGKKIRAAGPLEFIKLIYNANLIVTGSFHAVCFSLQLSKRFVYVIKDKNKSSRVLNLFQLLEIKDQSFNEGIKVFTDLEYSKVHERLEILRKESLQILRRMIHDSNNSRGL